MWTGYRKIVCEQPVYKCYVKNGNKQLKYQHLAVFCLEKKHLNYQRLAVFCLEKKHLKYQQLAVFCSHYFHSICNRVQKFRVYELEMYVLSGNKKGGMR